MNEELKRIGGLPDGLQPAAPAGSKPAAGTPKFSGVISDLIKDVDAMHKRAEEATQKMVAGELEDVHQVVLAMEEAQTSFRLLMEVRNKMVEAYKEIIKGQS